MARKIAKMFLIAMLTAVISGVIWFMANCVCFKPYPRKCYCSSHTVTESYR